MLRQATRRRASKGQLMRQLESIWIQKWAEDQAAQVMSPIVLMQRLAGELLVDPALLVETIEEDEDLRRVIKSYRAGDFTYEQVLDTLNDYF
jgi:hypothetical protein